MTEETGRRKRRLWTAAEDEVLRRQYPNSPTKDIATQLGRSTRTLFYRARVLGLKKSADYQKGLTRDHAKRIAEEGAQTRFREGTRPWNFGTRFNAGGRSVETRFQEGNLTGAAATRYRPIGSERVSKDGYLERKIHDGLPRQSRWRAVHILAWEAENGLLPTGHVVIFKDGNKRNLALDNLALASRAELMARNTCHRYGPEVSAVTQLRGAITRQLNKRKKETHGK
mgnify:FL=1